MKNSLTILFYPLPAVGHVNASIGLAEALRDRGHKIVFAIDRAWTGKLAMYGFIEEILTDINNNSSLKPGEEIAKRMHE